MGDATAKGGFGNRAMGGCGTIPDQFKQNRTNYGFGAELCAGLSRLSESPATTAPDVFARHDRSAGLTPAGLQQA